MDFDGALAILADLKARRELFVALTPPFSASFEIDREVLEEALATAEDADDNFKQHANEIGRMLFAVLSDVVEQYVDHRVHSEDEDVDVPEERIDIQSAIDSVRDHLYDDHLQRRYDLKKAAKPQASRTLIGTSK